LADYLRDSALELKSFKRQLKKFSLAHYKAQRIERIRDIMNMRYKKFSIDSHTYYLCAFAEYVPSNTDEMDSSVLQKWTRNLVFVPTPSAVATRYRNHHRRVDHIHSTLLSRFSLLYFHYHDHDA